MSSQPPIAPDIALRKFLDVIAEEATINAAFRNRLLVSLGAPIMFEGADDLATISPVEVYVRYRDEGAFKRIYSTTKGPALRKVLTSSELATAADLPKTLKAPGLIDILWERASERAVEDGR